MLLVKNAQDTPTSPARLSFTYYDTEQNVVQNCSDIISGTVVVEGQACFIGTITDMLYSQLSDFNTGLTGCNSQWLITRTRYSSLFSAQLFSGSHTEPSL